MPLILARRDSQADQVTLVKWQRFEGRLNGWWALTSTMIQNHRTPCLFPASVWKIAGEESKDPR